MADKNEYIKCVLEIYDIRRYKNDWCLGKATVSKCKTKDFKEGEDIRIKGVIPPIQEGNMYNVMLEKDDDPKWGLQYIVKSIFSAISFQPGDVIGQKKFLSSIFTPLQIEEMYSTLDDPFEVLEKNDAIQLVKVKGVGMKKAQSYIQKFNSNINKAKIYTELEAYNLTNNMIDKLLDRYSSPEMVIEKVKNNTYILCTDVKGIGWKTADKIALEGGMEPYSDARISGYIEHYLSLVGENGCSWITPDELLGAILEELGEDVPDEPISASLSKLIESKKVWCSEDKTKIGLKKYYDIENKIAKELIRLRDAKSNVHYGDWNDSIKHLEQKQGWNFTEEQINGIKAGLENNVTVITGYAGTGKSSLVSGILDVLKGYSYVQAALSGRAGARLKEITGEDGYTIHRLLGFPDSEEGSKNRFSFHDENQLPYDIYIIDEISMIDAYLFYYLLRAIPSGSKLYLLGDHGQLESIGSGNIAFDMINSPEINTVFLTKIHRQAEKSALITESIKLRKGIQLVNKDWVGTEVRGELQDLSINCFSDSSNTFYEVIKEFSRQLAKDDFDVLETQIIVPIKNRGNACTYEINNAVQELYNPASDDKREECLFSNGKSYVLREGDKVMCVSNNYNTKPPIFNGNIGILEKYIDDEDSDKKYMLINFTGIGKVYVEYKYWNNIEPAYALTTHKCIVGDTWVYSSEGIKKIQDLNICNAPGELKSCDATFPQIFNGNFLESPDSFYYGNEEDCKKITTKRKFSLTGTLDHGVQVINSKGLIERKNIGDIKIGDYVLISKGGNIFTNDLSLPKEWSDIKCKNSTKQYTLPTQLTPEFAQFMGHFLADGVISQSGFRFGKNQKEVVEEFARLTQSLFNCSVSVKHLFDGPYGGMWQAEVYSTYLRDYLNGMGCFKAKNKTIPECILKSTKDCQTAFLKGVFEDGTVNVKNGNFDHIELTMSSKQIIEQIRLLLLNLGIVSSYYEKHNKRNPANNKNSLSSYSLYIYKKDAFIFRDIIGFVSFKKIDRINLIDNYYKHPVDNSIIPYINNVIVELCNDYNFTSKDISDKNFFGNIKNRNGISYTKLELFLNEAFDEMKTDLRFIYIKDLFNNFYVDIITDISESKEQVYCLNMPLTHRFVQNGIWAWNCQGSQFDNIIYGLDFSSYSLLTREMVYTGITRAKRKCYLIAQTGALRMAISKEGVSKKQTHLMQCLHDEAHPKVVF